MKKLKTKEFPKGFRCSKCKKWHDFSAYVYAHWNIDLKHTCGCGKNHVIYEGEAYPEP